MPSSGRGGATTSLAVTRQPSARVAREVARAGVQLEERAIAAGAQRGLHGLAQGAVALVGGLRERVGGPGDRLVELDRRRAEADALAGEVDRDPGDAGLPDEGLRRGALARALDDHVEQVALAERDVDLAAGPERGRQPPDRRQRPIERGLELRAGRDVDDAVRARPVKADRRARAGRCGPRSRARRRQPASGVTARIGCTRSPAVIALRSALVTTACLASSWAARPTCCQGQPPQLRSRASLQRGSTRTGLGARTSTSSARANPA